MVKRYALYCGALSEVIEGCAGEYVRTDDYDAIGERLGKVCGLLSCAADAIQSHPETAVVYSALLQRIDSELERNTDEASLCSQV